ncbi:MAG: ATP-binding protein [Gammaproteobacteria bacterium]|nr:ATP-binding protein [Gammaproteobacteria bacterium]
MFFLEKLSRYETGRVVQLGFSLVIALVIIYAVTSLYQIRQSTNKLTEIVEIENAKIMHLYNMRDVIRKRQIILSSMLASKDPFLREEKSHEFFSLAGEFRGSREKLLLLTRNQQEQELLKELVRLIKIAQPINQAAISSIMAEFETENAYLISQKAQSAQADIMRVMESLIGMQKYYEMQFVVEGRQSYQKVFLGSVFSVLFLIILALIITRVVSDFVSQKNAELIDKNSELEEVSKLALEATRAKSTFLATMSHEIRTPLTAIIGFAEINLHDSITKEDRIRHSHSIVRNGKHLLQVINDILDISKLEADRIDFDKENFSVFQLLAEVEQIIAPQVKAKGLFIEFVYEYPIPESIIGDPFRLKQIILNLCSNAVKFTETGRINVKTSCDFITQKIFIEVIDTGIGMSEEQINKVFDVFTQADSTVTRKYGGTGLGLTLSKQFAERMGGEISAHSLPGIGSRFIVSVSTGDISTVKTVQKKLKSAAYLHLLPVGDANKRVSGKILLAEDNLDNQQLYCLLLENIGAEIKIAANGKEAVEAARNESFDIIFMDMQMPVMDGVEAIRVLRQSGYKGVIISLTANSMKQDKEACFAAGCNDYITKPVSKEVLYETVYQYLEVTESDHETVKNDSKHYYQDPDVFDLKIRFISKLPSVYNTIKHAHENKDRDQLKAALHKLKGLAGSFGYPEITNVCLLIEQSLARNDTYQCENLISKMAGLIKAAEEEIEVSRSGQKGN